MADMIPPPHARLIVGTVDPNTNEVIPTQQFQQFLQQFWAGVQGSGGAIPNITILQADVSTLQVQVSTINGEISGINAAITTLNGEVATIFGMHGDGTLSGAGVLIVTKTNGVAFGYFATGTDAANLTGTLAAARIANNSLPYAKLVNAAGASLLGASGATAIGAITVSTDLQIVGGVLSNTFVGPPAVLVSALGTATASKRAFVSDALGPVFGSAVVGGGAVFTPVYATGAGWFVG